jgi:hypothetical protein
MIGLRVLLKSKEEQRTQQRRAELWTLLRAVTR